MYENILVNGFQPLLDDHFPWSFSDEDEPLNQFKKNSRKRGYDESDSDSDRDQGECPNKISRN